MSEFSKGVGNRIKKKRIEKNLKQKQLLELLDTGNPQMVSGWEKGNSIPSATYLVKIAKTLDTSVDYLLTGIDNIDNLSAISDYGDVARCFLSLVESGLDIKISNVEQFNSLSIYTSDKTLVSFYQQYNKLQGVKEIIGDDQFKIEVAKLINRYSKVKLAD